MSVFLKINFQKKLLYNATLIFEYKNQETIYKQENIIDFTLEKGIENEKGIEINLCILKNNMLVENQEKDFSYFIHKMNNFIQNYWLLLDKYGKFLKILNIKEIRNDYEKHKIHILNKYGYDNKILNEVILLFDMNFQSEKLILESLKKNTIFHALFSIGYFKVYTKNISKEKFVLKNYIDTLELSIKLESQVINETEIFSTIEKKGKLRHQLFDLETFHKLFEFNNNQIIQTDLHYLIDLNKNTGHISNITYEIDFYSQDYQKKQVVQINLKG